MMRPLYFRRDGTPMERDEWAMAFEDSKGRTIKRETLWWGAKLSTVWLGLDHGFNSGPPLIFETMIFAPITLDGLDQSRYATEAGARAGHELMRRKWSNPAFMFKQLSGHYAYRASRKFVYAKTWVFCEFASSYRTIKYLCEGKSLIDQLIILAILFNVVFTIPILLVVVFYKLIRGAR